MGTAAGVMENGNRMEGQGVRLQAKRHQSRSEQSLDQRAAEQQGMAISRAGDEKNSARKTSQDKHSKNATAKGNWKQSQNAGTIQRNFSEGKRPKKLEEEANKLIRRTQ
eukprot:RCo022075